MDIDDAILNSIADEMEHLKKQLHSIKKQIQQRKQLSNKIIAELDDKIRFYKEIQNDALALDTYSHGQTYEEMREHIRQLIRTLEDKKRLEYITAWGDVQALQKEHRALERELHKLEKTYRLILSALKHL